LPPILSKYEVWEGIPTWSELNKFMSLTTKQLPDHPSENTLGIDEEPVDKNKEDTNNVEYHKKAINFLERNYLTEQDRILKIVDGYKKNPLIFFDDLDKFEDEKSETRLFLLSQMSRHLEITPEKTKAYFKKYPEDLHIIATLFTIQSHGPEQMQEYYLYTIAMPLLEEQYHFDLTHNQYLDIAERKNLAPQCLLKENSYPKFYDYFRQEYGEMADSIIKTLQDAINSQYDPKKMDISNIFSAEFENAPEEEKSKLLREMIGQIQLYFVFEETYNSAFTKKNVEETKNITTRSTYNLKHSILYKTKQNEESFFERQDYYTNLMNKRLSYQGDEEYALHKLLIEILKKISTISVDKEKNVATIVEFWDKNRNPIFTNIIAESLSKIDPNGSAHKLLEILKQEEEKHKRPISAMLYRLEFGKINISAEGVKYLERLYDLGEKNNPNHYAQRLTAYGDIGIFDEEKKLLGYFNLGDISSEEKKNKASVLEFALEQFFSKPAEEGTEEKKQQEEILQEFKDNYFNFFESKFFQDTGVRFNNLSFREQAWFMHFSLTAPKEQQEVASDIVKTHGEAGLKTFISLDIDGNASSYIFEIFEKHTKEDADFIFAKFAKLTTKIELLEAELHTFFKEKQNTNLDKQKILQEILNRALNILKTFSQKTKKEDIEKMKQELDSLASASSSMNRKQKML